MDQPLPDELYYAAGDDSDDDDAVHDLPAADEEDEFAEEPDDDNEADLAVIVPPEPDEEAVPLNQLAQASTVAGHARRKRDRDGSPERVDCTAKDKIALVEFYNTEPDYAKRLEQRQAVAKRVGVKRIRESQVLGWKAKLPLLQAEARRWGTVQVRRLTASRNVGEEFLILDHLLWTRAADLVAAKQTFTKRQVKSWVREIVQEQNVPQPSDVGEWLSRWCRRYRVTFRKPARTNGLTAAVILSDCQEFHAQLRLLQAEHDFSLAEIANADEMSMTTAGGMSKDTKQAVVAGVEADFAPKDITSDTYTCGSFLPLLPADGSYIPPLVIFKGGSRNPEEEAKDYDPRSVVYFTASGNVDENFMCTHFIPHLNKHWRPESARRLLICDHYKSHYTKRVLTAFAASGITIVLIPKGRTSFLQVLDTHCFAGLRELHKEEADKFAANQRLHKWKICAAWKRVITQRFATRAWASWIAKHGAKVSGWMAHLGYIKPNKDIIKLRKVTGYAFDETKAPAYKVPLQTKMTHAPATPLRDAPHATPPTAPAKQKTVLGRPPKPTPKHSGPDLRALMSFTPKAAQSQAPSSPHASAMEVSQPIDFQDFTPSQDPMDLVLTGDYIN